MPTAYLPAPKEIRDLLGDLLGREVTVAPTSPFAPGPYAPATVAVYVTDQLEVAGVIACDLKLSAAAGAAIGLVPPGGAADAAASGTLPANLAENLQEVLNVAAALFNTPGAPHLRLYTMHPAGQTLPADVVARALTLGRRVDLTVEVAGYGSGRLSIVLS